MNTQTLRKSAKRLGLALVMFFSLVLLGGISAQAQSPLPPSENPIPPPSSLPPVQIRTIPIETQNNIRLDAQDQRDVNVRNDNRYDTNDSIRYRSAVQYGHKDGMSQGRNDARRNRASNCEGSRHYQSARRGYNSRHGSYPAYQGAYRGGFTRGYNEAFGNDANRRNRRPN